VRRAGLGNWARRLNVVVAPWLLGSEKCCEFAIWSGSRAIRTIGFGTSTDNPTIAPIRTMAGGPETGRKQSAWELGCSDTLTFDLSRMYAQR